MSVGRKVQVLYQRHAVAEIQEHFQDLHDEGSPSKIVVLDAPTASGKTFMILSAIYAELSKPKEHRLYDTVLVLTPTVDIREGFSLGEFRIPSEGNTVGWDGDASKMVTRVGSVETRWVEEIKYHLGAIGGTPHGLLENGVLVACHASGVKFFKDMRDQMDAVNWSRILVVVDEAHHVNAHFVGSEAKERPGDPETGIGKLIKEVTQRGAFVLMTTATAFRVVATDEGPKLKLVYPEDARLVKVFYSDVVEQRKAPSDLRIQFVGAGDPDGLQDFESNTWNSFCGDNSKLIEESDTFNGEISEADADRLAKRIVKDGLNADGVPQSKSFVKISRVFRTLPDGTQVPTRSAARIKASLEKAWPGVRVVVGTGSGKEAEHYLKSLKSEREVTRFEDSKVDVFIVCGRAKEGTDWPCCSHFYHLGVISSIPFLIQIFGRTLRSKIGIEGYPEHLKNTATLTMFVPNAGRQVPQELRKRWHQGSLLAFSYIQEQNILHDFMHQVSVQIRGQRSKKDGTQSYASLVSTLNRSLPTEAELAIGAREALRLEELALARTGKKAKVPKLISQIGQSDLSPRIKAAAALSVIGSAQGTPEADKLLQKAVKALISRIFGAPKRRHREVRNDSKLGPDLYSMYLFDQFQETASTWDHVTSTQRSKQLEIMSQVTSQELPDLCRDLRAKEIPTPYYREVVSCVVRWYTDHIDEDRDIYGDLSPYLRRPPRTYSAATLRKDLRERRILEQPRSINCLQDIIHEEEVYW